jgi:hypothetical protein
MVCRETIKPAPRADNEFGYLPASLVNALTEDIPVQDSATSRTYYELLMLKSRSHHSELAVSTENRTLITGTWLV